MLFIRLVLTARFLLEKRKLVRLFLLLYYQYLPVVNSNIGIKYGQNVCAQ